MKKLSVLVVVYVPTYYVVLKKSEAKRNIKIKETQRLQSVGMLS